MSRKLRILLAAGGVLVALLVALVMVARSDWLREKVRTKIVEVVEKTTGGKATLASFDYDWYALRATVRELTLRGTETTEQAPLFSLYSATIAIDVRSWIGRDIELRELVLIKPEVHIYVAEDGSTNIPGTTTPSAKNPVEQLLDLEIARLRVENGYLEYDSKRTPLNIAAEEFHSVLTLARDPKHYALQLGIARLHLPSNIDTGVNLTGRLFANRAEFKGSVNLAGGNTQLELDGAVDDFKDPKVKGSYRLNAAAADLRVSAMRRGTLTSEGTATWDSNGTYTLDGKIGGSGLAIETPEFALRGVNANGGISMTPERITVSDLKASGFGGSLSGDVTLEGFKRLRAKGTLSSTVAALLAAVQAEPLKWNGNVTAPFEFSGDVTGTGVANSVASARVQLSHIEGQLPAEGDIAAKWDQRAGTVAFEPSTLRIPGVNATVQGVLGQRLEVGIFATDIREAEPYIQLFTDRADFKFPIGLQQGYVALTGTVVGPIGDPMINGTLSLKNVQYRDVTISGADAEFMATNSELQVREIKLAQNGSRISGSASIGLADWTPKQSLPLKADLTASGVDLAQVLRELGQTFPLAGKLDAHLTAQGTLESPDAALTFKSAEITVQNEKLHKVSGEARTRGALDASLNVSAEVVGTPVSVSGTFRHPAQDWDDGTVSVAIKATGLQAAQLDVVKKQRSTLEATLGLDARAVVALRDGEATVTNVDGWAEVGNIRDKKYLLGGLRLEASTQDNTAQVKLSGKVGPSEASGQAAIRLSNGYPGTGNLSVRGLSFEYIAQYLALVQESEEPMPLSGSLNAALRWRGRLNSLQDASGILTITGLKLQRKGSTGDLVITNAGPAQFELDEDGIQVRSARFVAKETSLTVAGLYKFNSPNPWDMSVSGTMNLSVLSTFDKDITASGAARLTANVRGTSDNPSIGGRATIENGSLYLKGMPNGIEDANGSFFFERDRATIESFKGKTGGGDLAMSGFVGLGGNEVSYRLQATATRVRVRYPEGVSTTIDADLNLSGSSNAAVLSGSAIIHRSGFSSQGDLGSYIAGSANPIPVPTSQNEFLRNLQFDIRVRTASDATFQTDYTQDIQLEADLRVRGSPAKPVVLGNVRINQGEVSFFGNRYTISRGEVVFFSTVAIQPSINLDLETRIRGVTVFINISGPLSRLNVNYRSEPPLQSSEILALLTVGRQPTTTSSNVPTTNLTTGAGQPFGDAGNTLLGGALSASVSSRVERFFGASRIKIDPNSTGVENIPQARLTIEQSLSRDITLTYSTNLSRTSQQIIRMEWNFSPAWSAIAVRDENGSFGMDFMFRKRFR